MKNLLIVLTGLSLAIVGCDDGGDVNTRPGVGRDFQAVALSERVIVQSDNLNALEAELGAPILRLDNKTASLN